MSDTTPPAAGQSLEKTMIAKLTTGAFRGLTLLMQALLLAFGGLALWQGKNMVNSAIAQSPDVVAVRAELTAVRADLLTAKAATADAGRAAADAASKADSLASTQLKIFQALNSIEISQAALGERIQAIKDALTRVEDKQDKS